MQGHPRRPGHSGEFWQNVVQEATVRTRPKTTDWFQIGKGVHQGCILSPCLLNICWVHIMQYVRLDESQPGIKTPRKNINNLRYADDTTLMVESEEELKSLLIRVKEERGKAGLKLNIQKLRSWHLVPSLHGKQEAKSESSERFYFLRLQNHCRQELQPWN